MKIITWNCNMAFRKKARIVLKNNPDILVIQECEHPDKLVFKSNSRKPTDVLWFGANKNKGLGIFSFGEYKLKLLDQYDPNFKLVIPIAVTSLKNRFTLYAVWAHNPTDPDGHYITQVWKAINHYESILKEPEIILAGDFNSNTIWDKPRRVGNHSHVVNYLEKKGIHSTYHHFFKKQQGKEVHPTLYMYRQKGKPYHIDYCFASKDLIDKLKFVEVGKFRSWCRYSDHVPVTIAFDLE